MRWISNTWFARPRISRILPHSRSFLFLAQSILLPHFHFFTGPVTGFLSVGKLNICSGKNIQYSVLQCYSVLFLLSSPLLQFFSWTFSSFIKSSFLLASTSYLLLLIESSSFNFETISSNHAKRSFNNHIIRQCLPLYLTYHEQPSFVILPTLNLQVFAGALQHVLDVSLVYNSTFVWTVSCSR